MLIAPTLLALSTSLAPSKNVERKGPEILLTAVARTRPGGGLLGAEALFGVDEDNTLKLGGYLNYFYYWGEMGAKLEWRYLGGFLVGSAWLGLEPGEYVHAEDRAEDTRSAGMRAVARARLELNYRPEGSWYWIYSRSTFDGRLRDFLEFDPFREVTLRRELTFEQALAPLFRIVEYGENSAIWGYVEGTVATEVQAGLIDLRPSAGIIYENILPGITVDLDVYYGLRKDTRLEGLGVLLFVWWRL